MQIPSEVSKDNDLVEARRNNLAISGYTDRAETTKDVNKAAFRERLRVKICGLPRIGCSVEARHPVKTRLICFIRSSGSTCVCSTLRCLNT